MQHRKVTIMEADKLKEVIKPSLFQRIRKGISDVLCLAAIACIFAFVLIICSMWVYAWQHNLYPRVAVPRDAYRGAWSGDSTLINISDQTLTPLAFTFIAAILSCIVKPNRRAGITLLLGAVCVFVLICHVSLLED
jgi:hypothetical protein